MLDRVCYVKCINVVATGLSDSTRSSKDNDDNHRAIVTNTETAKRYYWTNQILNYGNPTAT